MKLRLAVTAAALAALILTASVFAAKPIKNARYAGKVNKTSNVVFTIAFHVSANGKQVGAFNVPDLPIYCQGGGFGAPGTKSATISKQGTFTVKLPIVFAPTGANQGNLIITGKFGKHGSESGKATTSFTKDTMCNGTSTYQTKVAPLTG